jgi:hypothetical protein
MADYGINPSGFEIKPVDVLLAEAAERARAMFGSDVDLRSSSTLRQILNLTAFGHQELWKAAERQFYAGFVSTATGEALDLAGESLGVERRFLFAQGKVKLTLANEAPGRVYQIPLGTLLETDPPVRQFRTLARVALSDQAKEAEVEVVALRRGPLSNVAAAAIQRINPDFAARRLTLGAATVTPANEQPTAGGELQEDDISFRTLLLGFPRTLWTLESVRQAVKAVDGVRDCWLLDPAGGVDVSGSRFKLFAFSQRRFGSQRLLGSPYRFQVLVATLPGYPWDSFGGATGVREEVEKALEAVRPVSIFPALRRANHVQVGLRARVLTAAGHDSPGVLAEITRALEHRINALGLGRSVLYSEVLYDAMGVAGVIDVQGLRLRRCPPLLERITFGRHGRFQGEVVELPVGENLDLDPDEIAEFKIDGDLLDVQVGDR